MDVVIGVAIVALLFAFWVVAVCAVVSAARTTPSTWQAAGRSKLATIILIVITTGFGGAYYWWRIRPELREAGSSAGLTPPTAEQRAIAEQQALRRR